LEKLAYHLAAIAWPRVGMADRRGRMTGRRGEWTWEMNRARRGRQGRASCSRWWWALCSWSCSWSARWQV